MAQLIIKINGFSYSVACEDGQEAHLQAMAGQVEARIKSIKALGGQNGEARLLMLVALLMADELHDMTIEMNSLRASSPVFPGKPAAPAPAFATDPLLVQKLGQLAARAEEIATQMERA